MFQTSCHLTHYKCIIRIKGAPFNNSRIKTIISVFDFKSLPNFDKDAPPLKKFLARDGIPLGYRFYESCNVERAIILLHGSSAHGEYLDSFADYLNSKRNISQIYVPNLRRHYNSGTSHDDCDHIGQLEDDLYDLIHQIEAQNKKIFLSVIQVVVYKHAYFTIKIR